MRHLLLLAVLLPLAACDSGGAESAADELAASNAKISAAVSTGLAGGVSKTLPPCEGGGSVEVAQSGNSYEMTFDDCNDVTGTFDVRVLTGSMLGTLATRLDGDLSVRGGCDVDYNAFESRVNIDLETSETTLTYNGGIGAMCPSGDTQCSFDDVSFTIDRNGNGAPSDFGAYCD